MLRDLSLRASYRATWALAVVVVAALVVAEIALNAVETRRARALQDSARGYVALTEALNAEIGYVGLIHNFKNCLIRPGETRYCDAARANAAEAQRIIRRIERLGLELDLDLALAETRRMVETYGRRVDVVEAGHRAGRTIREIDETVRFDDRPAHEEIARAAKLVSGELARRIDSLNATANLRVIAGLIVGSAFLMLLFAFQAGGERRRAMLIAQANERLQTLMNTVSSGVFGLSADGRVLVVNDAGRRMLDRESEAPPFDWPDGVRFLSEETLRPLDASADPVNRAVAGLTLSREVNLMAKASEGETENRYVSISSARVGGERSAIRSVIVLEDVTEQRQQRQQIDRSQRLDALGQLTGGLAHDFNNLLATIQYSIELARLGAQPEKLDDYLAAALGAVRSGADLTRRLLAFAKRQPGMASSRQVGEAVSDLLALARPVIEERIEIAVEPADEALWVYCDQAQLENALLNLLLNSRDAVISSGVGGRIRIAARRLDAAANGTTDFVEIAVSDDGPGMSDEVRRRAVDPFFSTKASGVSSGLGLSMVYGFVKQSGGDLSIETAPGEGTVMRLVLPRGAPTERAAKSAPSRRPPFGAGEKVLLVEDESGLRLAMAEMLRALNYHVVSAVDGRAALELLEHGEAVDVLLTDIVMPGGLSGFDLAARLRQSHPELPVIYMSGYAGFTGDEMGALVAPLLQKPCSAFDLGAALRQALGRS